MFSPFSFMGTQAGGGGDVDADAYILAVTTAGGTLSAGDETAIQTFFVGLKTASIYSKIACMYPFMGGVASSNAIDAINPGGAFDLTFNGGWTHAAGGANSNGTNAYANTQFNPTTEGYTTYADFHYSFYNNQVTSQLGDTYSGGALDSLSSWCSSRYMVATTERASFGGGNIVYTAPSTQQGLRLFAGDTSTSNKVWFNNSQVVNRTITQNVNFNLDSYIGCLNYNASAYGYKDFNYVYFSMGNGFTTAEAGDYNTLINDLQTTLGRNTY